MTSKETIKIIGDNKLYISDDSSDNRLTIDEF